MLLTEQEIKECAQLVAECEASGWNGGKPLTIGQTVDLIADNRCDEHSEWSLEKCRAMANALHGSGGVGPFHLAEARSRAIPMVRTPGGVLAPDYAKPGVSELVRREVDDIEAMCWRKGRD